MQKSDFSQTCKNTSSPCSPAPSTEACWAKADEGKGEQKDPNWQTKITGKRKVLSLFWLLRKIKNLMVCKVSSTGREDGGVVVGEIWRNGEFFVIAHLFLFYSNWHLIWVVVVLGETPEGDSPNSLPIPILIVSQQLSEGYKGKTGGRTQASPHSLLEPPAIVRMYFLKEQPNRCSNHASHQTKAVHLCQKWNPQWSLSRRHILL